VLQSEKSLACGTILLVASVVFVRRHIRDQAAQAQRDPTYDEILSGYQRNLHAGATRAEVQRYFDSRKISYLNDGKQYDVFIGKEPGEGLVCDRWSVHLVFDFGISGKKK